MLTVAGRDTGRFGGGGKGGGEGGGGGDGGLGGSGGGGEGGRVVKAEMRTSVTPSPSNVLCASATDAGSAFTTSSTSSAVGVVVVKTRRTWSASPSCSRLPPPDSGKFSMR